jgi:hypothetical protein
MTASAPFKKTIVPCGPHDYDAFLDDNYIGSFHTPSQAQAELDRVAYEQARHTPGVLPGVGELMEADLAADPLAPFGVLGGPDPTLPVTDDALDRAFEIVTSFYEQSPAITSRAERALEVAKDRTRFTVRSDGSVMVQGSRRYQVTDDGCTCKDFFVRDGVHAGMCKHIIARELWRLAQATQVAMSEPTHDQPTAWAFCSLPSTTLGRALKKVLRLAVDAQTISVRVTNRTLTLHVDGTRIVQLVGDDGCGARGLVLSGDIFAALCANYTAFVRPFGRESIAMQVLIDHDTGTVAFLTDGFASEAPGSPT